jgi:group I intron endonuclease
MSKMIGIYCIRNKINGKGYIGQSENILERIGNHKKELKNNKHYNKHLQSSYNKYGKDNFEFICLQECLLNQLAFREKWWMNLWNAKNNKNIYNIALDTECPSRGRKHTEETRKKISIKQKGKKYRLGIKHTEETKKKMSILKIGKKHTEEHKNKISIAQIGKKCTKEKKQKISISNSRSVQMLDKTTNKIIMNFSSTIEASLYLGNKNYNGAISDCCNNKRKSAYGYKWKFIQDTIDIIKR